MKKPSIKTVLTLAREVFLLPIRSVASGGGALIYFPRSYSGIPDYSEWLTTVERLDYMSRREPQTAFIDSSPETTPKKIWMFFGGNGALALDWLPVTSFAPESPEGFVFVEYPGYGFSRGRPSPESIKRSIDDLIEALISRFKLTREEFTSRLGVVGHSLGAALAMDTAARHHAKDVILVSPFTTMKELAVKTVGPFFARFLRHHYDNYTSIRSWCNGRDADEKIAIFHGTDDELIPIAMAERLAQAFPDCVELHAIEGGDHNGILLLLRDTLLGMIISPMNATTEQGGARRTLIASGVR